MNPKCYKSANLPFCLGRGHRPNQFSHIIGGLWMLQPVGIKCYKSVNSEGENYGIKPSWRALETAWVRFLTSSFAKML